MKERRSRAARIERFAQTLVDRARFAIGRGARVSRFCNAQRRPDWLIAFDARSRSDFAVR